MKKTFTLFLSIFCILTILTACGNSGKQPNIDLSETTKIDVSHFNEGNSPGDKDGGEVYSFASDKEGFSYIKNGFDECYILYNSDWYQVKNPTDPLTLPASEIKSY